MGIHAGVHGPGPEKNAEGTHSSYRSYRSFRERQAFVVP